MKAMKRILKDPLLHFLLVGAAIFVGYAFVTQHSSVQPDEIVITQGKIEHLATTFAKTWQRPPTAEELQGLIREHVREEVFYREAKALGLDQDDTVIRRRLRQKMEFISDDIAAQKTASDADLETYLQEHADTFRLAQRFTFQQVHLDPQKHGDHLAQHAAQLLTQLNGAENTTDAASLGDLFLLEHQFNAVPGAEITKHFGGAFAAKLSALQTGSWQGPIESSYGMHLVKISERTEGRVPALAEVREAVQRDWDTAQRLASNEKFHLELLKRYTVTIEQHRPAETGAKEEDAK